MNGKGTRAEFYVNGAKKYTAFVSGVGAVPITGDLISIRGKSYRVLSRTWAVDHADSTGWNETELRVNFDIEPVS